MSSKLREAVSRLVREIQDGMLVDVSSKFECDLAKTLLEDVKSALAEPRRNCDVGSVREQDLRFDDFCNSHQCDKCPMKKILATCSLGWANMPYEEEE